VTENNTGGNKMQAIKVNKNVIKPIKAPATNTQKVSQ